MDAEEVEPCRRVLTDAILEHWRAEPHGHKQARYVPKTVMSHCARYKNAPLQPIAYQQVKRGRQ